LTLVEFRSPTLDDINHVATTMRKADIDEVWASNFFTPHDALLASVEASHYSTAVVVDEEPIAILGLVVRDVLTGVGIPWLLASDSAMMNKRLFFDLSPGAITEMLEVCPTLYNYVDARNRASIRWLKWLGFEFEEAQPYGALGLPFHRFYRHRGH